MGIIEYNMCKKISQLRQGTRLKLYLKNSHVQILRLSEVNLSLGHITGMNENDELEVIPCKQIKTFTTVD